MSDPSANASVFRSTGRSRKGEPWVWLTAAGLSLGILMALCLLLLILFKGLSSFWPRQIELMEIKAEAEMTMLAGYVVEESERLGEDLLVHEQLQVFRGNKDVFGESFLFIDASSVLKRSLPEDLLLIERQEFGPAILHPVALETPGGRVDAADPRFESALLEMVERGESVRERTLEIKRKRIGANSRAMQELGYAEKAGEIDPSEATRQREQLQQEFERLQAEAVEVEASMDGYHLHGRTGDGRELSLEGRKVYHVFEPNRAGIAQRVGEMLRRIWKFLSEDPREANTEGGVFPAIFGTVIMTLVMTLFATPLGVVAAIYLREYAKQGLLVRVVRICVNNLAGVPSIVFGVFGLAFFVYCVGTSIDQLLYADKLPTPTYGTPGILWASLTLALLTLPVVIVAAEEALSAVPRGVREAALACGASKWQVIQRVVIPASLPGIMTGIILAMARGAGEVAPLMLVGVVKMAPALPIDDIAPFVHPERKFMHLGFHIYDLGFQSPDAEAVRPMVYATALLLILIVLILNLTAIIVRNRLKKKFAVSHF